MLFRSLSKILGKLCSSSKCLHAFPKLHNHPIHSMFLQSQKYLVNSAFLTNIYTHFQNRIAIHSNAMSYMANCNDSVLSLVCGVCKAFVRPYLEASVSLMSLSSPPRGQSGTQKYFRPSLLNFYHAPSDNALTRASR